MFGIKPETIAKAKVKAKHVAGAIAPWAVFALITGTITAAWDGYSQSRRNERELRELKDYAAKIDHGGGNICNQLDERIKVLEEINDKLLEEACDVTEGKETAE